MNLQLTTQADLQGLQAPLAAISAQESFGLSASQPSEHWGISVNPEWKFRFWNTSALDLGLIFRLCIRGICVDWFFNAWSLVTRQRTSIAGL